MADEPTRVREKLVSELRMITTPVTLDEFQRRNPFLDAKFEIISAISCDYDDRALAALSTEFTTPELDAIQQFRSSVEQLEVTQELPVTTDQWAKVVEQASWLLQRLGSTCFRETLISVLELIVDPAKQEDLRRRHPYVDVKAEMIELVLYYDDEVLALPSLVAEFNRSELSSLATFRDEVRAGADRDWSSIVNATSRLLAQLRSAPSA